MPTPLDSSDATKLGLRQMRAAQLQNEARAREMPVPDAAPAESQAPQIGDAPPSGDAPLVDAPPGSESPPSPGAGPVGSGAYLVKQGDCLASIARDHGHFWETLWNDPANAELRDARQDPNVLLPGDRVHIPPLRKKLEPGQTEMRHRFRLKNEPEVLRLRVLRDGQARGNQPYTLEVDGAVHSGTTDVNGLIECPIPANARRAKLQVGAAADVEEHVFQLGAIDPITELSGVQGRLNNLGFDCGLVDGRWGPQTERTVRKFQAFHGLPETGVADDALRERLQKEHGC